MSVAANKPNSADIRRKFRALNINDDHKLAQQARKGVSPQYFYDLATIAKLPEKVLAQLLDLSPRTISNYKDQKKALAPTQGEHLLKLIQLYEKGTELFGNVDEFNYWLQKPFWDSKQTPADWIITPGGVDLVLDELVKMAFGDAV